MFNSKKNIDKAKAKEPFDKARIYFDQKKYDKAIKEYTAAYVNDPDFDDAYVECADAFFLNNEYKNAAFCLNCAIVANPKNAKAHNNLGLLLKMQGNEAEAQEELKTAAILNPKYRVNIGADANKPPKIVNDWTKETTLIGDTFDNEGVILQKQGNYLGAIPLHEKAIEFGTTNLAITNNNLGYAFYNLGNFNKAIYYYDKAIEIDPNYSRAIKNKEITIQKMKIQ